MEASSHCCAEMERRLKFACSEHADEFACPDSLISYSDRFSEYGLIIHDGGTASILIKYCPWCGAKLPNSSREVEHE